MPTFGKVLKTGSPDAQLKALNGELRLRFMQCLAAEVEASDPGLPARIALAQLQGAKDAVVANLAHVAAEHARLTPTAPVASSTVAPTSVGSTATAGPTTTVAAATSMLATPQTPTVASQTPTMASNPASVTVTPSSSATVVDDSTADTPAASTAASGGNTESTDQWESDGSSRWGNNDDEL